MKENKCSECAMFEPIEHQDITERVGWCHFHQGLVRSNNNKCEDLTVKQGEDEEN